MCNCKQGRKVSYTAKFPDGEKVFTHCDECDVVSESQKVDNGKGIMSAVNEMINDSYQRQLAQNRYFDVLSTWGGKNS